MALNFIEIIALYERSNFMFQIIVNTFSQNKMTNFGFYYYKHAVIMYTTITMAWLNCCKVSLWFYYADRYKRYSICLILFFSLIELFSALICAYNIGSMVNNLFGVNIFNPFPVFRFSNLAFSAIVSCRSFSKWLLFFLAF